MRKLSFFLLLSCLSAALSSCYPMPADDCVSTIPMTNNPQIVPQRGASWMPGATY